MRHRINNVPGTKKKPRLHAHPGVHRNLSMNTAVLHVERQESLLESACQRLEAIPLNGVVELELKGIQAEKLAMSINASSRGRGHASIKPRPHKTMETA